MRPIVVLSTSRAAMGLEIGMDELRAEFSTVGDLTDEEAKCYIKKLCQELELEEAKDDVAVSKYAGEVVHALGSRLLHLDSFAAAKTPPCTRSYADARAYGKHGIIADWNGIAL